VVTEVVPTAFCGVEASVGVAFNDDALRVDGSIGNHTRV
jgi:hypothetical protein